MGYKQDWSPRKMDLHPTEAILQLDGLAWWDAVQQERDHRGKDGFYAWALRMARPWYRREKIIRMMAWNDHNSTFYLELEDLLRTHRFLEGDKVTAEIVAESLMSMVQ